MFTNDMYEFSNTYKYKATYDHHEFWEYTAELLYTVHDEFQIDEF